MERFVCVRPVQMWGVDLSLFQFHGQLTWAVFFLNADRTIYGRYGSRGATGTSGFRDNDREVSLEGFKKAIEGALEIHAGYPGNKASLAGKTGPAPLAKTPEAFPAAKGRPNVRRAEDEAKGHGCIHCHQVQDFEFLTKRQAGQPVADRDLWTYPMPDVLGFPLDPKERARVAAVTPGSPAEKAGLKAGDRIQAMDGQPVISTADVQWVLHNAAEPGSVRIALDGRKDELTLSLSAGWRRPMSFSENLSLGWVMRSQVAGMRTQALAPAEKQGLGLAADALALRIVDLTPVQNKERNPSPRQAGLQKGDVLVEIDGRKSAMSESEFLAWLVEKKKPGDRFEVAYLRAGQTSKVTLEAK
jgi:hypothetical protein